MNDLPSQFDPIRPAYAPRQGGGKESPHTIGPSTISVKNASLEFGDACQTLALTEQVLTQARENFLAARESLQEAEKAFQNAYRYLAEKAKSQGMQELP
jgi:hypothetical protein